MTEETKAAVVAAAKAYRRAKATADDRRAVLADAIRQAHAAGDQQSDIARASGYTREYVARVLDKGKKRPDAEPGHDPVP